MKTQTFKNRITNFFIYCVGISILLLFFLNFYMISPEKATEIILQKVNSENLPFKLSEVQKLEIQEVLNGVDEYDLPSLTMEFNREVELREGLIQVIEIEVLDTKDMGERAISKYQAMVRIALTDQQSEDTERIYSGMIVLSLDRVSMRQWKVVNIQTLPFRDNTI